MMIQNKFKNHKLLRIMQHLAFWMLAFFVLIELFAYDEEYAKVDYIYTGIFLLTLIIPSYFNLYLLIPKFLSRKKGLTYTFSIIILIFVSAIFNYYLFSVFVDYIIPGYYFISYYSLFEIIIFFVSFLFVTALLKLSREWFQLLDSKRRIAQIEKEKAEAEMKVLKSHLDPHFLFNSLNVIYSLARNRHKNTSDAIIQLSDIMRFITYDAKEKTIDVNDEVILIEKYIALQQYRLEENADIKFKKEIKGPFEIAPLLLLPLVENAYKHGIKGNLDEGWINMSLKVDSKSVIFEIENNMSVIVGEIEKGGSGLTNIRKRLDLIYPGKHTFELKRNNNIFKILLSIGK